MALLVAAPAAAELKKGDNAPTFEVEAATGGRTARFSSTDALRKGPLVLYFYPKSFTSVCTVEAHEFAESADEFAKLGASLIGVSADSIDVQKEFSSKECREKFPVGADVDLKIARAFDVVAPGGGYARRVSYVIAADGKIASVLADPGATAHIKNALSVVRGLAGRHSK
jgi:peroxiredoxin